MSRNWVACVLHSPVRLVLAVAVVVLLGVGAAIAANGTQDTEVTERATHGGALGPAASQLEMPDEQESVRHGSPDGEPASDSRKVLDRFLRHYLQQGTSRGDWHRVKALTTETLWRGLQHVPTRSLPRGDVRSIEVLRSGEYVAHYLVEISTGRALGVMLVYDSYGWRVAAVQPKEPA